MIPWNKVPVVLAFAPLVLAACGDGEPEVGSDAWCEREREPGRMDDYTMKEVSLYAKHCMFEKEAEAE